MTVTLAHVGSHPLGIAALGFGSAMAAAYVRGVGALWARHGANEGIAVWRVVAFGLGAVGVVAASGPVVAAAEGSLTGHMLQHQLLLVSAPLLVLGRPGLAVTWALPRRHRSTVVRWRRRLGWYTLTRRPVALVAFVGVLWLWHLPAAYEAALRSPALHTVEHLSLLLVAGALWTSLSARHPARVPAAVGSLFLAGVGTVALAGLLLFAGAPLYPSYAERLGAAAIDDQEVGAVLMWAPSAVVGLMAAMALVGHMVGEPPPARHESGDDSVAEVAR